MAGLARIPLSLGPVHGSMSYKHHEWRRQHPAASLPATPCSPTGMSLGVQEGLFSLRMLTPS